MNKELTYQLIEARRINDDAHRLTDLQEGRITFDEWMRLRNEGLKRSGKFLDE